MATFALLIWPVIAIILMSRLPREDGIIWSVLLPYLFLPEAIEINLPGLPDPDKTLMISIGLVVGALYSRDKFRLKRDVDQPFWASPFYRWILVFCISLMLLAFVLTIVTNREPLVYGPLRLPGMRLWDMISLLSSFLGMVIPAYFAIKFLATPHSHIRLAQIIVLAALGYTVLMVYELRFSPQLHNMVYGYFQHSFNQHVRNGYRPIVFLDHGLSVGFFVFTALIAAIMLWRSGNGTKWGGAALWFAILLVFSRNLGALMIAIFVVCLMFGFTRRIQTLVMVAVAALVISYPAVRQSNLLPLDQFLSFIEGISANRAQSLEFRLRHEDALLDWAQQKPVAGWGLWARNRLFTDSGESLSVTDGLWILVLGTLGWTYYIGFFGLISGPIYFLARALRRKEVSNESFGFAMILMGNLIYIIPNATLTPLGWMLIGALSGVVYKDVKERSIEVRASPKEERRSIAYSRFQRTER